MADANTTMCLSGKRDTPGKRHFVRLVEESVRDQPFKLTVTVLALWSSIQGEKSPSSSLIPCWFSARNSEP